MTGNSVTCTRSTRLAAISARFNDKHPRECPIGVGAEDHPLLDVVQRKAVLEELGALLAPVAGPVGAGGAVAVEAGKDVEGVGSGHVTLLGCRLIGAGTGGDQLRNLIAVGLATVVVQAFPPRH